MPYPRHLCAFALIGCTPWHLRHNSFDIIIIILTKYVTWLTGLEPWRHGVGWLHLKAGRGDALVQDDGGDLGGAGGPAVQLRTQGQHRVHRLVVLLRQGPGSQG